MCVRVCACSVAAHEVWAHNLLTGQEAITHALVTTHHQTHLPAQCVCTALSLWVLSHPRYINRLYQHLHRLAPVACRNTCHRV
jgi:hypothetical protein